MYKYIYCQKIYSRDCKTCCQKLAGDTEHKHGLVFSSLSVCIQKEYVDFKNEYNIVTRFGICIYICSIFFCVTTYNDIPQ